MDTPIKNQYRAVKVKFELAKRAVDAANAVLMRSDSDAASLTDLHYNVRNATFKAQDALAFAIEEITAIIEI